MEMETASKSNSGSSYTLAYQPLTNIVGVGIYVKNHDASRIQLRCHHTIPKHAQRHTLDGVYMRLKQQEEWGKHYGENNNYISIGVSEYKHLTSAFADAVRAILRTNYECGGYF